MQKLARRAMRHGLLYALITSLLLVPAISLAATKGKDKAGAKAAGKAGKKPNAAKKRVALGAFSGPKAGDARDWALTGLKNDDGIEVIADDKATGVAPGAKEAAVLAVASSVGATAVVLARVNLQKKVGWSLSLWVYNGADGKLIEKLTVRGGLLPGLRKKLEASISEVLAPSLAKATAGEGVEPEPEAEPEVEGADVVALEEEAPGETLDSIEDEEPKFAAEAAAPMQGVPGVSPLDLRLGLRVYRRSFNYTGTLNDFDPNQPPLLIPPSAPSPMFIFSGNLYPLAMFTVGPLAHIGLMVGYEQGFLTKTALPDPAMQITRELNQSHTDVYFGVRYRLMLAEHEVIPFLAFGKHSFSVEDDRFPYPDPAGSDPSCPILPSGLRVCYEDALPDVNYSYIDIGVAPRFVFDELSLGLRAAYRIVNDTGGLQKVAPADRPYDTWFPNAKASAVTAGLQGGYAITDLLEIQIGFDFTRYGLNFNPIPTVAERTAMDLPAIPAARIAGGATDTYISGWLGLGVRFPGFEVMVEAETPDAVVEDPENEDVEELDF